MPFRVQGNAHQESGGTQDLEKYQQLGVKEVWFWVNSKLEIYILNDGVYQPNNHSFNLPKLEDKLLKKYLSQALNDNPRTLKKSFLEELN